MDSIEKQLNIPKSPVNNAVFSMAQAAYYNSATGAAVKQICGSRPLGYLAPIKTKRMKERAAAWDACVAKAQENILAEQSQNVINQQLQAQAMQQGAVESEAGMSTTAKIAIGVTALALVGTAAYFLFK